jgi:hypothetical protein
MRGRIDLADGWDGHCADVLFGTRWQSTAATITAGTACRAFPAPAHVYALWLKWAKETVCNLLLTSLVQVQPACTQIKLMPAHKPAE